MHMREIGEMLQFLPKLATSEIYLNICWYINRLTIIRTYNHMLLIAVYGIYYIYQYNITTSGVRNHNVGIVTVLMPHNIIII